MGSLAACAAAGMCLAWAPVPCPGSGSRMMTPWGEKVTPANAWRDYPRPQLVREGWTNLNGLWEYAITSNATYTSVSPWDKFEPCREVVQKGEILVPFAVETPLSGVGRLLEPTELLWYRRTLNVAKKPGHRILLGSKFDAAVRQGDNVLAVKVVQTAGGQYFDTGLSVEVLK